MQRYFLIYYFVFEVIAEDSSNIRTYYQIETDKLRWFVLEILENLTVRFRNIPHVVDYRIIYISLANYVCFTDFFYPVDSLVSGNHDLENTLYRRRGKRGICIGVDGARRRVYYVCGRWDRATPAAAGFVDPFIPRREITRRRVPWLSLRFSRVLFSPVPSFVLCTVLLLSLWYLRADLGHSFSREGFSSNGIRACSLNVAPFRPEKYDSQIYARRERDFISRDSYSLRDEYFSSLQSLDLSSDLAFALKRWLVRLLVFIIRYLLSSSIDAY